MLNHKNNNSLGSAILGNNLELTKKLHQEDPHQLTLLMTRLKAQKTTPLHLIFNKELQRHYSNSSTNWEPMIAWLGKQGMNAMTCISDRSTFHTALSNLKTQLHSLVFALVKHCVPEAERQNALELCLQFSAPNYILIYLLQHGAILTEELKCKYPSAATLYGHVTPLSTQISIAKKINLKNKSRGPAHWFTMAGLKPPANDYDDTPRECLTRLASSNPSPMTESLVTSAPKTSFLNADSYSATTDLDSPPDDLLWDRPQVV